MRGIVGWLVLVAVLFAAALLRFIDLGRSAVRADEMNFLVEVSQGLSLLDRWRTPPGLDQIPLADSVAIIWHWFRPGTPDEHSLREPFALIGCLTVAGVAVWLYRRRGFSAAAILGVWLGLLPFHVHQSREAYYYVVVMAVSAGMTLHTVDLFVRLRRGDVLTTKDYLIWFAWTVLTCLSHICTWVIAALCWVLLVWAGLASCPIPQAKRHAAAMAGCAAAISLIMIRFVLRAVEHVQRASHGDGPIGGDFWWVAPRVIPFFTSGANAIGVTITAFLLCCGGIEVVANLRKRQADRDERYAALTVITVVGFALVYAYVGAAGSGVGKVTYFSGLLPVFLAWSAYTLDLIVGRLPAKWPVVARVALPCLLATLLATPAWMVTRLEGKPSAYRQIRDWLDTNLDPGSVVLVDRWFEPWNEMAIYAPKNVFVTFTVPDEPFEVYEQLRWRDVTKATIKKGVAQAFIRLTRKYESRAGLWTWPEIYLSHRAVLVNDVAMWLREHGYSADDSYYSANFNRLVTEIFYDKREDTMARRKADGDRFVVFFDRTLRYMKTGPMGIFRFQTEQFMDWRVLDESGAFDVCNLTAAPLQARVRVRGISPLGPKKVAGPDDQSFEFAGGQLQEWTTGPLTFEPGTRSITLTDPGWNPDQRPLLIESVEILPETPASR